jgi:hypothetical protein
MHCRDIVIDGKVVGIACGSRSRPKPCKQCGARSTRLCDYPLAGKKRGTTCDAPLCDRCAVKVGPDRDFCRPHANLRAKQVGLTRFDEEKLPAAYERPPEDGS